MSDAKYTVRFEIDVTATSPERAALAARDILLGTDTRILADVFPFEYVEAADDWFATESRGWQAEFDGAVQPVRLIEWYRGK
jgi:hypothetical protein